MTAALAQVVCCDAAGCTAAHTGPLGTRTHPPWLTAARASAKAAGWRHVSIPIAKSVGKKADHDFCPEHVAEAEKILQRRDEGMRRVMAGRRAKRLREDAADLLAAGEGHREKP